MAYTFIRSGQFLAERGKLANAGTRLFLSSADFIDAAFWSIAGGRVGQGLVLLDNAIEVALKGDLERVHKALIVAPKEFEDFDLLAGLLVEAFENHPSVGTVVPQHVDIERTISFDTAFDRVAQLYPGLSDKWRKDLISSKNGRRDSLHSLRNNVVHYGASAETGARYVEAIVDTALPFLEELFSLMTQGSVSVPHLMKEWVYKEVNVAQRVLADCRQEGIPIQSYAIRPLAHHVLWTHSRWPSPIDDLDTITWSGETDWQRYFERKKLELLKTWDEGLVIEMECPVCDSYTDGSFLKAQILLENDPLDNNELIPEGFNCFVCGFEISPAERFLARHFVGQLPDDVATAYLNEIGNI